MADFPYKGDLGVDSIAGIKAAMLASGIPHTIVSTYRAGSRTLSGKLSYHARKNAVDESSSTGNMLRMAQWIRDHYGPYTLELIYSGGPGVFVHNGKIVGADAYGAAVVAQHYNHVHWAITNAGLAAGNASASGVIPASTGGKLGKIGCVMPGTAALIVMSGIGYGASQLVAHIL